MRVLEIKDCEREESPIYYRRAFNALAVIESARGEDKLKLKFIIETSPLGTKKITINMQEQFDFPVLEINKILKKKIEELDEAGSFPL
ncbi:MAG: hypothetical protein LBG79_03750 [Spirochaetaceae bacterium]|nr:hypothetical protein [Spirochaetaceae bacterium]GMO26319.1 MAG: hypothetical protein Pg6A_13550 [Termitinemataceae bacterium]